MKVSYSYTGRYRYNIISVQSVCALLVYVLGVGEHCYCGYMAISSGSMQRVANPG